MLRSISCNANTEINLSLTSSNIKKKTMNKIFIYFNELLDDANALWFLKGFYYLLIFL